MQLDWNTIITTLISGGFLFTLYETIKYRKQNNTIKSSQATQSNVEAQKAEIELGNLYKEEMLKVIDLLKKSQTENTGNQEEMKKMLTLIDKRVDNMEVLLAAVVKYLNGNFQQFLAEETRKAREAQQNETNK